MDALVCQQPGELRLERRPVPVRGPDQVLVRPRRVGICGTDYHIVEGKHPFLQYPRVMGHELAVEIVETPEGSSFAPGEICVVNPYLSCGTCVACRAGKPNCCVRIAVLGVHIDGGMAPLLTLPAANLVKSRGLGVDACATVEFLAIGAHAVRRGATTDRDRVLVIGAGPIGLGVALFASLSGATVTMMDIDATRLAAAESLLGVSVIQSDERAMDGALALTSGEGFDIVFDATGNTESMTRGFDFVTHGGRYVLVGVVKGTVTFEDSDFHRKEMTIFGSRNATMVDFERVIAAIEGGHVAIDRWITHRTTLADAIRYIPLWAREKHGLIKAVISVAD